MKTEESIRLKAEAHIIKGRLVQEKLKDDKDGEGMALLCDFAEVTGFLKALNWVLDDK